MIKLDIIISYSYILEKQVYLNVDNKKKGNLPSFCVVIFLSVSAVCGHRGSVYFPAVILDISSR